MFDALTHLYRLPDVDGAMQRARAVGVEAVLLAGVDEAGWVLQSALASPDLSCAYGLHPWQAQTPNRLSALSRALDTLSPPVAIGEIGLDGSRRHRHRLADQRQGFLTQLALARQRGLPVVLHIVRAHGSALECLASHPPPGGFVHGFSGAPELVPRYLKAGLSLSFGRLLCSPEAHRAHAAARVVPIDNLLIETDAPDQLSGPAQLPMVLQALSRLRPEPIEELRQRTADNARRILSRSHPPPRSGPPG